MGGRGRGRGRGMSFNIEQLGFSKGEALPGIVTAPPPVFPPLEHKPLPLVSNDEQEYLLIVRKQLTARMKDSPYFLNGTEDKDVAHRYSDRLSQTATASRELPVVWSRFPAELRPRVVKKVTKRKPNKTAVKPNVVKRSRKVEDVTKRLEELEEKEKVGSEDEEENKEANEEDEEGEEKEKPEEEIEDEEVDEELDFGTDYMNSYFDNGEGFLDEDENLDDEPVF